MNACDIRFNYYPFTEVDRYWVLDSDGKIRYKQGSTVVLLPRSASGEVECTGLPSGITALSVQIYDWTRYIVLSRVSGADEFVDQYSSSNCVDWTFAKTKGSQH
jgi:hypothetical protein